MRTFFEHPDITVLSLFPGEELTNTSNETEICIIFLIDQAVELEPGDELTAEMTPLPDERIKFVVKYQKNNKLLKQRGS